MNRLSVKEIVKATGGKLLHGREEECITAVKHDSRQCGSGDMFVAIDGENRNGHEYIPQVLEAGCRVLLVSETGAWSGEAEKCGASVIMTEDTVYAMGELAKHYLDTLSIKKVAVTGSVGKTSVRDMIYYVLSEKYNCGRNMKNFNNNIGVPLSVFQFDDRTEAAVIEMGMDKPGEIDRLAQIVRPDIAVITNIGMAHIENFGSREGIFHAKMEVTAHLGEGGSDEGTLVFADDDMLTKETTRGAYRQVSVGRNGKSDYIISSVDDMGLEGIQFNLEHLQRNERISVPVPGIHSAVNASIAVAVGELMGLSVSEAAAGLKKVELTGSRLKRIKNNRLCIIDDTYNASPDSMKSSLKILENSDEKARKIAILGDMFELGSESERQHFGVGVFSRGLDIDVIIAIGKNAAKIYEGALGGKAQTAYYEKKEDFYAETEQFIKNGDIILVKGSRGMRMEQIVEKLLEH